MTKNKTLLVGSLCMLGCVSDFSPDPHNANPNQLDQADAGRDAAAPRDASAAPTDASTAVQSDAAIAREDAGNDSRDASGPPAAPKGPCDLSGRWIVTERSLSSGFGAKQVSQGWMYAELTQDGDNLTFAKSLYCGGTTDGIGFPVHVDDSQAWPAYQAKMNYTGRTGTSKSNATGGCDVTFAEAALVRGMTVAVYKDKNTPIPKTVEEKADGDKPGWEDWDDDGRPGVTQHVSGVAQGNLYTCFRAFTDDSGSIPANATNFTVDKQWFQERSPIQYAPPTAFILVAPAERAPDPGANLVEYTRLADDQATGNDDAICEWVRANVKMLCPKGTTIE